jgi:hypothetical protein
VKQKIDECVAGGSFIVVVGISNGRIGALRCGDFGAQCRNLRFKRGPLRLAGKVFLLRCLARFDRLRGRLFLIGAIGSYACNAVVVTSSTWL